MIREAKNDGTTDGLFVIVELTTRPHSYDVRERHAGKRMDKRERWKGTAKQ